jgi:hypothetical protein
VSEMCGGRSSATSNDARRGLRALIVWTFTHLHHRVGRQIEKLPISTYLSHRGRVRWVHRLNRRSEGVATCRDTSFQVGFQCMEPTKNPQTPCLNFPGGLLTR